MELIKLAAAAILVKIAADSSALLSAMGALGNQGAAANGMTQDDRYWQQAKRLASNKYYTGPKMDEAYRQAQGGFWANPQVRDAYKALSEQAVSETLNSVFPGRMYDKATNRWITDPKAPLSFGDALKDQVTLGFSNTTPVVAGRRDNLGSVAGTAAGMLLNPFSFTQPMAQNWAPGRLLANTPSSAWSSPVTMGSYLLRGK